MNLKCVIIDDEVIARELLAKYISKIPELELMGSFGNALNAMQLFREGNIDILFLDIEMPNINGLDFLKSLNANPSVILTTAYSEYAIQSYDLGVLDYLIKPIEFDRFYKAINKALAQRQIKSLPLSTNSEEQQPRGYPERIFVKANNKVLNIDLKEVLYITSKGAYIQLVMTSGEKFMVLQSMNRMEEILPDNRFFRVHRSHIVNIRHVKTIEGNTIKIGQGKEITISKSKREAFLQHIDNYNLLS